MLRIVVGDWSSGTYIASQILVIIGVALTCSTYFLNKREYILLVNIISNIFTGASFFMLSAWLGVGMTAVKMARDTVGFFVDRKRKPEDKKKIVPLDWFLLCFWLAVFGIVTYFTFDGWLSLFGALSPILFTIAIWQKNVLVYRILGVVGTACRIVYNAFIENFFGTILESMMFVLITVGLILFLINLKTKKQKEKELTLCSLTINNASHP